MPSYRLGVLFRLMSDKPLPQCGGRVVLYSWEVQVRIRIDQEELASAPGGPGWVSVRLLRKWQICLHRGGCLILGDAPVDPARSFLFWQHAPAGARSEDGEL